MSKGGLNQKPKSKANRTCFGRRICPGSDNNKRRGVCKNCIPCIDQYIAYEIERGRRLSTLLDHVRIAWAGVSDYLVMKEIARVSRNIGKIWGYRAVRSAIKSSPELRNGGDVGRAMRAEIKRAFRVEESTSTELPQGDEESIDGMDCAENAGTEASQ